MGLNLEALTIASIRRTLIVHTGSEGMNEARVELLDTKKCTLMCAVAPVETLENIEWIRVV